MKKLAFAVMAILFMVTGSQAQYIFNKGDIGINAGIGAGGLGGFVPSIEASVEFGVIPTGDIGLVSFGGGLGWKYTKQSYDYYYYNESHYYNQFVFSARAAWHLHTFKSDKYDVYGGVGLGLRVWQDYNFDNYDGEDYYSPLTKSKTSFYQEIFVGGRMMLSPEFGLFAEAGYSKLSVVRFGLTFLL